MSQWYCGAYIASHPLPMLTNGPEVQLVAPISRTRLPRSLQLTLVPLKVGDWVGLSTRYVSRTRARNLSWVRYSTTRPDHCTHSKRVVPRKDVALDKYDAPYTSELEVKPQKLKFWPMNKTFKREWHWNTYNLSNTTTMTNFFTVDTDSHPPRVRLRGLSLSRALRPCSNSVT